MKRQLNIFTEIIAFIFLLMLVNFLFAREDIGFHELNPNPFWLVIMMSAVRYGTGWGCLAAMFVSIIYLATLPWDKGNITGQIYTQTPVAVTFFIIAFLLGERKDFFKKQMKTKDEEVARCKEEIQMLKKNYNTLEYIKNELEVKVLRENLTLSTLYETAQRLGRLHPNEIYPAILKTLREYLEADKCSLYLVDGNHLRLKSYLGYGPREIPPETMSMGGNKLWQRVQNGEVATMRERMEREGAIPDSKIPSIMCAPIRYSGGKIIGMINIEQLPFVKFHEASINLFSMIVEWGSRSLETASRYEEAEVMRIDDTEININSYHYLEKRLNEEIQNARRYGTTFSLAFVRIEQSSKLTPELYLQMLTTVIRTLSEIFREVDLICRFQDKETLAILLPLTSRDGARIVRERTRRELAQLYTLWHDVFIKEIPSLRILLSVDTYHKAQKDIDAFVTRTLGLMEDVR